MYTYIYLSSNLCPVSSISELSAGILSLDLNVGFQERYILSWDSLRKMKNIYNSRRMKELGMFSLIKKANRKVNDYKDIRVQRERESSVLHIHEAE